MFLIGLPRLPAQVFDLGKDREPMMALDGLWRFHPGDDPDGKLGWAQPDFDDSKWALISSEIGWSDQGYRNMSGMAWYRAKVFVGKDNSQLSLYIPKCYSSYRSMQKANCSEASEVCLHTSYFTGLSQRSIRFL